MDQGVFPTWPLLNGRVRLFAELRLGSVQPIGDHERTKNHEHDEKNVFDFHGYPLVNETGRASQKSQGDGLNVAGDWTADRCHRGHRPQRDHQQHNFETINGRVA